MPRLTDLISNAKSGRQVKDLLGLDADTKAVAAADDLVDRIALLEATFLALADDVQAVQLKPVLSELAQIATTI